MKNINLGGSKLKLEAEGVDEALDKLNLLMSKLKEAKSLINDLASMEININLDNIDDR